MSTENAPTFVIDGMITHETALSFLVFLKNLRDTRQTECNIYFKSASGFVFATHRMIRFIRAAEDIGLIITSYVELAGSSPLYLLLSIGGKKYGTNQTILIPHLPQPIGGKENQVGDLLRFRYKFYKVFRRNGFSPKEIVEYSKSQKPLPLNMIQRLNLIEIVAPF